MKRSESLAWVASGLVAGLVGNALAVECGAIITTEALTLVEVSGAPTALLQEVVGLEMHQIANDASLEICLDASSEVVDPRSEDACVSVYRSQVRE